MDSTFKKKIMILAGIRLFLNIGWPINKITWTHWMRLMWLTNCTWNHWQINAKLLPELKYVQRHKEQGKMLIQLSASDFSNLKWVHLVGFNN